MYNKAVIILLLLFVGMLLACARLNATSDSKHNTSQLNLQTAQAQQTDSSKLKTWLGNLRSSDGFRREEAKKAILTFSNESEESRRHVIEELLKIAATPDRGAEFLRSHDRYLEWKEATDILGKVKAIEAIDLLIECLDCNNGPSGLGPGRYPATLAIIEMGEEAIPKLADALEQKRLGIRYMVVQALHGIGGDEAKAILENAQRKEKDQRIVKSIENALLTWDNSGKNRNYEGQSTDSLFYP